MPHISTYTPACRLSVVHPHTTATPHNMLYFPLPIPKPTTKHSTQTQFSNTPRNSFPISHFTNKLIKQNTNHQFTTIHQPALIGGCWFLPVALACVFLCCVGLLLWSLSTKSYVFSLLQSLVSTERLSTNSLFRPLFWYTKYSLTCFLFRCLPIKLSRLLFFVCRANSVDCLMWLCTFC